MSEYTPVHGDQITGSPATLSRYITQILAAGAHFQFVDGETIEVLVPGAGEAIVTTLGDTVVEAKPAVEEHAAEEATATVVTEAVEAIEEIVQEAVETAVDVAVEVEEAKPAPAKRGRKPAAAPAPEVVEGE